MSYNLRKTPLKTYSINSKKVLTGYALSCHTVVRLLKDLVIDCFVGKHVAMAALAGAITWDVCDNVLEGLSVRTPQHPPHSQETEAVLFIKGHFLGKEHSTAHINQGDVWDAWERRRFTLNPTAASFREDVHWGTSVNSDSLNIKNRSQRLFLDRDLKIRNVCIGKGTSFTRWSHR